MKNPQWIIKSLLVLLLSFISILSIAQGDPTDSLPDDPGALSVFTVQDMKFGAFSQGSSGGTVIMSTSGSRSVTGDVIALNLGVTYFQAIFEIAAPEGTIISILNGPNETLTGSNGGTMSLNLGSSDPGSPFSTTVQPPTRTQVSIGGTLMVGNPAASPPGAYTATFYITFNQE